jgi:nucleoside-diphosphate-sugar epimerase
LVTGGAGYIGSILVPHLLGLGFRVTVLDLMIFGNHLPGHHDLRVVRGDLRDSALLASLLRGQHAVVHLAGLSNDPEYALAPDVGRAINWQVFPELLELSHRASVSRFIFASSCSLYGAAEGAEVDEGTPPAPLTDYARLKWKCERHLQLAPSGGMMKVAIRAATVCGRSPRQRFDLLVNGMIAQATIERTIRISTASRVRPCVHIRDLARAYARLLTMPFEAGTRVYNVAYGNRTERQLAEIVRGIVGTDVCIETGAIADNRSYAVSSAAIRKDLGFVPRYGARDAVRELAGSILREEVRDPLGSPAYHNLLGQQQYAW